MTKRNIDCVAMKELGSKRVYEQLDGMTMDEELAFWNAQDTQLTAKQSEIRAATMPKRARGRTKQSQNPNR
ncbi:MAG: hypothetical protein MUC50_21665 [Myxococcota bacterium]|jgi:hypothetical protein|nr:hypothetical protein [Myxococcota bacterium]